MYDFIVNPASHSGKGLQLWKQAERLLKEKKLPYKVYFSKGRGDVARIAGRLTSGMKEGEERLLVVLGGDGTVNEAVQGIKSLETVRLCYIPTGSSNDLARALGISQNPMAALSAVLTGGRECRLDIGRVFWEENGERKERRFVVSCGIGYDAAVCEEALSSTMKKVLNRLGLGKLTYLMIGLKQMIAAEYAQGALVLDEKERIPLDGFLFAAAMIHRYEGGGFCFCPQADAQDGMLDICVVSGIPRWKFPVIIPFALKGKHTRFAGVKQYRAKQISIETSVPLWVHTDGEIPGKLNRITVTDDRQQLRFVY